MSMTPALKAMVAAMAAEIKRQGEASDLDWLDVDSATGSVSLGGVNGALFHLEKVARAGLEAIRTLDSETHSDLHIALEAARVKGSMFTAQDGHVAILDAILKAAP